MNDLRDLYQDTILEHYKKPRNFHDLPDATAHADGYNPLCGDKVKVYLKMTDGVVTDVAFEGSGCAISTASASIMTEALKGKTVDEANRLFTTFHDLVTEQGPQPDSAGLGKLAVFGGVREFPMRVKCATLAWHTMKAALDQKNDPVSTE
ncbi:MAG: SUF system NifU family Fe-S cluster assembly protein [Candidatus Eisenbacteria bacterium]|nr:SUF system NifU family Fe-S cluster assembly protein [Candidatus Eisenbacteria bacterium]